MSLIQLSSLGFVVFTLHLEASSSFTATHNWIVSNELSTTTTKGFPFWCCCYHERNLASSRLTTNNGCSGGDIWLNEGSAEAWCNSESFKPQRESLVSLTLPTPPTHTHPVHNKNHNQLTCMFPVPRASSLFSDNLVVCDPESGTCGDPVSAMCAVPGGLPPWESPGVAHAWLEVFVFLFAFGFPALCCCSFCLCCFTIPPRMCFKYLRSRKSETADEDGGVELSSVGVAMQPQAAQAVVVAG